MMDAILYAVRDGLRAQNFGYSGPNLCEIQAADGKPPPGCGNIFVAVCEGSTSNNAMNNLDEYFDWSLVLTMRISVDPDRVGVSLEASKLARKSGPGNPSFNARVEQLRAWGVDELADTCACRPEPAKRERQSPSMGAGRDESDLRVRGAGPFCRGGEAGDCGWRLVHSFAGCDGSWP